MQHSLTNTGVYKQFADEMVRTPKIKGWSASEQERLWQNKLSVCSNALFFARNGFQVLFFLNVPQMLHNTVKMRRVFFL